MYMFVIQIAVEFFVCTEECSTAAVRKCWPIQDDAWEMGVTEEEATHSSTCTCRIELLEA